MSDASLPIETVLEIRDSCLCLATQRAARVMARRFDRVFAPLGLTNGQFSLMVALSGNWQPKMGELAGFLAMDQTTLTSAVKTLEKRGWVALVKDEGDARVRRPALRPAGRDVLRLAVPLWVSEHHKVQAESNVADPKALAAMLNALGQEKT